MTGRFLAIGECMVEMADAGGGLYRRGFAGDTFNTAWYARRLLPVGWQVDYGTCVGTDAVSDEMLAFMQSQGIGTGAIGRVPDRTVGLYMISLQNGERSFSYWRSQSAARLLAGDPGRLAAMVENRDILYFSGITLAILDAAGRNALCNAISGARAAGARVAFDTNLRPRLWESEAAMKDGLLMGAGVADIVLPSLDEEQSLSGDATPADTIARYAGQGARLIAVKDGAGPVTLWEGGKTTVLPVEPVRRVVDTTAAGDSFAAGLLAGIAAGMPAEQAARSAIALSAKVIHEPGALVRSILAEEEA